MQIFHIDVSFDCAVFNGPEQWNECPDNIFIVRSGAVHFVLRADERGAVTTPFLDRHLNYPVAAYLHCHPLQFGEQVNAIYRIKLNLNTGAGPGIDGGSIFVSSAGGIRRGVFRVFDDREHL